MTTCSTLVDVQFVELTVRTTMLRGGSGTRVRVRGTLVTVAAGTSVGTLFGVDPSTVGTGEDVVANTLHRVLSTGGDTLTVLTNARHVRGVTTVVATGPGVLVAIKVTVTAVAVPTTPACSVTLVGILHTVVAVTSGSSTTVRCVTSLRVPVPVLA